MSVSPSPPPPPPLRYVVLRHEGVAEPHFDFMIETAPGSALTTWRAERWPPASGDSFVRLPDHRAHYLTYVGPISGGRGHVSQIESGAVALSGVGSGAWVAHLRSLTLRLIPSERLPLWHVQVLGGQ